MGIGDYTDEQVRAWLQGKSRDEIAAKAASLNLNPGQIQGALKMVGQNYSTNDIQNYATQRGYKWDQGGGLNFRSPQAAEAYADSQRGQVGGRLHDFVTNRNIYLGNETDANAGITPDQVKQWFAQNPNWTPEQIGQLASKYHMTPENVAQAISIGTGADYNPQKVRDWIGNQSAFRIENDGMISAPGRRSNGFNGSADGRRFGQYGPDGNGYADGVDPALGDSANFAPLGNTTPGYGVGQSWGNTSSMSSSSGGINPYLDQMAGSITNQLNTNWTRNLAPSIRSGAMAAGGFGGTRQGVVEANGLRDLNQTLGNSLANLYGTGWQNAQQNALQSRSIDNNYDLGLRSNNLGFANLDSNNAQFGANLALNTLNAQNNWAQNGVNAANQMYQMPLYYQNMFNTMQNGIAGQGGTQTNTQTNQGNPLLGALGGWKLAGGR